MERILVVDDDESTRCYLGDALSSRGYEVDCLDSGAEVLKRVTNGHRPSAILLDLLMPGVGGLDVLAQMQERQVRIPTIVLSAVDSVATVVRGMRLGAADYLVKPVDESDLLHAIESLLENECGPKTLVASPPAPADNEFDFVSACPKVLQLKKLAAHVAQSDVPVLILGESGVGKELLSRFLHSRSPRRRQPFVKVNCAALPGDLLESELFGYERGAFTGALHEKPGRFSLADKGSILLDEIGEMSYPSQAKLLHVLQDGEFTRLGGTRPVRVDVRIVAATNRNLEDAVRRGQFREDLYYRLNVIKFEIPPLRERREDIPLLFEQFVSQYREKYGCARQPIPPSYREAFQSYDWPGNVRELESLAKRFLILPDPEIALAGLREKDGLSPALPPEVSPSLKEVAARASESAERSLILRALEQNNWNKRRAARELNVCYKSLLNKVNRWQLTPPPSANSRPSRYRR